MEKNIWSNNGLRGAKDHHGVGGREEFSQAIGRGSGSSGVLRSDNQKWEVRVGQSSRGIYEERMPVRGCTETLNEIRWDIYDTNVIARYGGDRAD